MRLCTLSRKLLGLRTARLPGVRSVLPEEEDEVKDDESSNGSKTRSWGLMKRKAVEQKRGGKSKGEL